MKLSNIKPVFTKHFIIPSLLSGLLILANFTYGFLLFHTLAELFAVVIGILMFVVVWSTHKYIRNNFFLYLGIGYLWIAILDIFHTLTYKGLPFFDISDSNTALHFWMYARFFEVLLILSAPLFLDRQLNKYKTLILGGLICCILFYFSLYVEEPIYFIEGIGLTPLKTYSEYLIIALLFVALFVYWRLNKQLSERVRLYILLSISFTIAAEFSFTKYVERSEERRVGKEC